MGREYEEYYEIEGLLQRVRQAWRSANIRQGVLIYASALLGATLAAVAAECSLADSPEWLRRALTGLVATVAALGLAYWVLWRILQDRTDEEFALLVERTFPRVDNGLINAVRLAQEDRVASPDLVAASMRETLGRVEGLWPASAVDRKGVKRSAASATLLAALAAAMVLFMPARVANAVARLLMPAANLAKVGNVKIVRVDPGDRTGRESLVSGETLGVTVTVEPVGLREVEGALLYREKGEKELKTQRLRMVSETSFKGEVRDVKVPMDYQARVGRSTSRSFKVEVVEPPTVTEVAIDYQYPDYTGEAPKTVKDSDGTVRAVVGALFGMHIASNRALQKAWLRLDEQEEAPLSLSIGKKGAYLMNRMKIEKDRTYTIHVMDEQGYENRDPVQRNIRALPDAKPTVQIVQPGKDEAVAPGQRMTLVARAADDYAVSKAVLMGRLRRNNEEGKDSVIYPWPQVPEGKKIVLSWDWVFDKNSYRSGDIMRYYVIVEDNNNVTGPGVGKSAEFEVSIRDPEKVKQEQLERYENWQAELEKVLQEQIRLREHTAELEKRAGSREAPKQAPAEGEKQP